MCARTGVMYLQTPAMVEIHRCCRLQLHHRWRDGGEAPPPVVCLSRILGTVLTRVDLSRLRFYDYYRSSAYLKPYGSPAVTAEAAQ